MLAAVHSQHTPAKHFCIEGSKNNSLLADTSFPLDVVDSPEISKLVGNPSVSEKNIFDKMKYECNRLYSFERNWPVKEIAPKSLAAAGFFFLQHEDRVQCPFCEVIVFNWTGGDNPLSEHIKKSPKCPFLVGVDVGNVPLFHKKSRPVPTNVIKESQIPSRSTSALYKPQHPRMADVKRRLLTYGDWRLDKPTAQQLAECGLYYTGVADVVKCFFCGGSLGNWESNDDPWIEHYKFFPECAFLSLAKSRNIAAAPAKSYAMQFVQKSCLENGLSASNPVSMHLESSRVHEISKSNPISGMLSSSSYSSDIVKEALDIFPKPLVLAAVKQLGGNVHSLQSLCDQILELNEVPKPKSTSSTVSCDTSSYNKITDKSVSESNDALLCKICMDRQSDVLFQPCGHLVSCSKCAQLIADCPVCRRPIAHVIKAYFC